MSVEAFALSAMAEKLSSFSTYDYLEERAKRANLEDFRTLLAKVADVRPDAHDAL